jgi:tetraacyldisaccharide 4'-kinase
VLAVDGGYGFGNGRIMPAGPLRENLRRGIARADGVVLIGNDGTGIGRWLEHVTRVHRARLVPVPGPATDEFADRAILAFAGIARPEKFYVTLRGLGCRLVATRNFPDHHRYTADEIMALVEQAAAENAVPVTTAKDAMRLPADARAMVKTLDIELEFYQAEALGQLLAPVLGDG